MSFAISPAELAVVAKNGLLHIDRRTALGKKIPVITPAPKFNADVAKATIHMLEGKLAAIESHCKKQERIAYINLTGITTIQTEIGAKVAELEEIIILIEDGKGEVTRMVCQAAVEAFKETLELLAQHQTRMEGMA
jgi:hypothetical protein